MRTESMADAGGHRAGQGAELAALAQQDMAMLLSAATRSGALNRNSYQDWLAVESALCALCALALTMVAEWHASRPAIRSVALDWAGEQSDWARLAAADVRALDGCAAAPPAELVDWQAFVSEAGSSQRVGETLGAVALHAAVLRGPVREVIAALACAPLVEDANGYLVHRLAEPERLDPARDSLLNHYAAASLAQGGRRAARWYAAAMRTVFPVARMTAAPCP